MAAQSSIDRLPEALRKQLKAWLRDPAVTQRDATEAVNALIAEHCGDAAPVSKSAVNRYAMRMREAGKKIRQQREIAEAWAAEIGAKRDSEVGPLLNEMIRTLAFEAALRLEEGGEAVPPKVLQQLALAHQRLESARLSSARAEKAALADAGERVEEVVQRQGLSKDVAAAIRAAVEGGHE